MNVSPVWKLKPWFLLMLATLRPSLNFKVTQYLDLVYDKDKRNKTFQTKNTLYTYGEL